MLAGISDAAGALVSRYQAEQMEAFERIQRAIEEKRAWRKHIRGRHWKCGPWVWET